MLQKKEVYLQPEERTIAQWVFENRKRAGTGTEIYPEAHCLYLAIRNEDTVYGVIGIALEEMKMDVYERKFNPFDFGRMCDGTGKRVL